MDHGVKTSEIRLRQLAKVSAQLGNFGIWVAEIASGKKIGVQSHNFMSRLLQKRGCDGADISLMTCQNNSHSAPLFTKVTCFLMRSKQQTGRLLRVASLKAIAKLGDKVE